MTRRHLAAILVAVAHVRMASAQQRPLITQDPEPIGAGRVLVQAGVSNARDESFPLSGLSGNLWQLPVIGFDVGLSPIADLQFTGGPNDRLVITGRQAAPLAGAVTATGSTTHDVDDINIGTKIRLVPETDARPSIGFRFSVRLPNAKHESGLGQDTTDFSASLLAGKTIGGVRTVGNVGVTIMSEPLDPAKQNDVLTYGISIVAPVHAGAQLVAEVSGRWSTRNGPPPIGTENRGIAALGVRYTRGATSVDAAAFVGIEPVDPTIGATVGWTYIFKAFALRDSRPGSAPISDPARRP